MIIKRLELLQDLVDVTPGLSKQEFLEQSSCFIFRDGKIFTFNDEIACRKNTALAITGAISAATLMAFMEKLPDEELEVTQEEHKIKFKAKGRTTRILLDPRIELPVERVEEEIPKGKSAWSILPGNFCDIIDKVKDCVGRNDSQFALTCMHFHPKHIEACDQKQAIRWRVPMPIKESVLVRGDAISKIIGRDVVKMASSLSWLHFKTRTGLIFSCRKFVEEYHDLDAVLKVDGSKVGFTKAVAAAADRASIASREQPSDEDSIISVTLEPNRLVIQGEGLISDYSEVRKEKVYTGPKITFTISPNLLNHIATNYTEAQVSGKRLRASGGHKDKVGLWDYVSVLGKPRRNGKPEVSTKG